MAYLPLSACLERVEQHGDRVAAADRVAVSVEVGRKAGRILRFYQRHALAVERLDRLVDLCPVARVLIHKIETLAPVAKVR